MASSHFSAQQLKYDVFLSFRGEDTRHSFTAHLYAALSRKSILTFMDNNGHIQGQEIRPAISQVIKDSRIALIIFSENYVSSTFCLDEVAKIMECKASSGQMVMPIFYNVTASQILSQKGVTQEEDQVEKVPALITATRLSGWVYSGNRSESEFIDEIVLFIFEKLKHQSASYIKGLVGLGSGIGQIKEWLAPGSLDDVRIIGIWGMGGIGKTTLAEAVFHQIAYEFEGCCFLANVRERSEKSGGLTCLQEELLSRTLEKRDVKIDTPNIGYSIFVQKILSRKRVLIVVDDASSSEQLDLLVGNRNWFGSGSRIIITSRDKQVLTGIVDYQYEVKELGHDEALHLFSQNAFKKNHPTKDYWALSHLVLEYANGIPLALKVLGSYLFDKSEREWESALDKLTRAPNKTIHNVLKISYDDLDAEEKDIFLHIACFFKGASMDLVTQILDGCGLSTNIGLSDLFDKSLIYVSNDKIEMHDLLQEMGKEIVRQESKEPGKRSRLWNHEDIFHVLKNNTGTEAIEGILLEMSKINKIYLNSNALERMFNLKFLKFYNNDIYSDLEEDVKLHFSQGLESLPDELRYLYWHGYPLKSLPANFEPINLIFLKLPHSKIKRLWKGDKDLKKLKVIDLSYSQGLVNIPKLSKARNLTCLKLFGCKNIRSLPCAIDLRSLRTLDLSDCSKLEMFPEISRSIRFLYLNRTAVKEVPSSIVSLKRLRLLEMNYCTKLESLPSSICKLKFLENLSLHGCSNLQNFPQILENMESLKVLVLNETGIRELPSSIECLKGLSLIYLENCRNLAELPESFCNLKSLYWVFLSYCPKLQKLPRKFSNLTALEDLRAGGCNLLQLPSDLNHLYSISKLDLSGNNFEELPTSIKQLSHLQQLDVSSCKRLHFIPELPPSLAEINAHGCRSLETISGLRQLFQLSYVNTFYRKKFMFTSCFKLDQNAWSSFLADAKLWIQKVATRVSDEESLCIWYPGSIIPEWFTYQGEGNSIMIQLPPPSNNTRLSGFALCVVLTFQDNFEYHNSFFNIICKCHFEDNSGGCSDLEEFYSSRSHVSGNVKYVWSEHVLLFYDPNFSARNANEFSYNEASFKFYCQDNRSYSKSCKVKKCAVLPLYAQEEENCNQLELPMKIEKDPLEEETSKKPRQWDGSGTSDEEEQCPKRLKLMKGELEQS